MDLEASRPFVEWHREIQDDAMNGAAERRRRVLVAAMIADLLQLTSRPTEETDHLRRVVQARRHPLWRMSHTHDPVVQIRLILWFPPERPAIACVLFGGDKAGREDVWYSTAVVNAEQRVDQIKRRWDREGG
jgi:hypothetical protein